MSSNFVELQKAIQSSRHHFPQPGDRPIDENGRSKKIWRGNGWQPAEVLAALPR